jgi:hypothetical protein
MRSLPIKNAFLLSAALALLPAANANADVTEDLGLEAACENVVDYTGAKTCIEPFYKAAMSLADEIYSDVKNKVDINTDDLNQSILALEFVNYPSACHSRENETLDGSESIMSYMTRAQTCLSISSRLADHINHSYDQDKAGYLIHRARLLKHMDVK